MSHAGSVSAAPGVVRAPVSGRVAGRTDRVWSVVAALAALVGEGVAVAAATDADSRWNELAVGAVVLAYAAVGMLILWHRPGHPVGRISAGIAAVWGVGQALVAVSYDSLLRDPHATTAALGSNLGSLLRGLPWLVAVMWLPLVFPDGQRSQTRLARVAGRVVAATLLAFTAVSLFAPTLTDLRVQQIDNPIGVPARSQRCSAGSPRCRWSSAWSRSDWPSPSWSSAIATPAPWGASRP